ncbi:hypothetical protein HU200_066149 [Digitaria exilis]|uniref:DUF6857 domain-containing protein n=1 Tax=Digitaria exilis TaxID=1010633 RepID=A0A835A2M2_9POAL|nr:hypothetical protein HU200_066149 [Digitaria exilis]CAB3491446.1 unnamed protein product [Digitaria exilis]
MDRSKKSKPSLASQRRFELLDLNKSSSSLNMSTSSLKSVGEETKKGGAAVKASRRATRVRFAPPTVPSPAAVLAKASLGSVSQSHQVMARPATASGARPGSASGTRCRTSAGKLPEPGPKAMRRSWGWTGGADVKEKGTGNPVAAKVGTKINTRSSSVPRRLAAPDEKEKTLPKRGSKIMTISTTEILNPRTPPKTEMEGSRSPPSVARKNIKAPNTNSASLQKMDMVSAPTRTSVATIGASWVSLPSNLQDLGLEVMRFRDDAEAAAVEALKQASAAEILLRCLSAFADLTSAAAELSPQQTVDEFLALHSALTSSTASAPGDAKQEGGQAADWLRAAVSTDLARFCLCSAPSTLNSGVAVPLTGRAGEAGVEEPWVEAAWRGLGEEMRAWFLGHVEVLLDGDVAGTLGQLKRVNDWLDAVGMGPESEAVERVRKKIYGYLLDHVESAVVALNGGVAGGRRK